MKKVANVMLSFLMIGATCANNPVLSLKKATNAVCYGGKNGSISLSTSAGIKPYQFSINGGSFASDSVFTQLSAGTYTVIVNDSVSNADTLQISITQPNIITLTASLTNPKCFGSADGASVITVGGGYGAFTFQWTGPDSFVASSQSIYNLKKGTYDLRYFDAAGCIKDTAFTLVAPSLLSASSVVTDVRCFGETNGKIVLSPVGGTTPYAFAWTGPNSYTATTQSPSNLQNGSYSVKITDANGCFINHTATVGMPAVMNVVLKNIFHVACASGNTGSVYTQISGGNSPYTYDWVGPSYSSGSANPLNLFKGKYELKVTDSKGCEDTLTAYIHEPKALTLSALVTDVRCFGENNGKITTTIGGGVLPYKYAWSSGDTTASIINKIAATYTITVTDSNSCKIAATRTINQPTDLELNYTSSNAKCKGDANGSITILVSGGTYPWNYYHTGPAGYTPNTGTQMNSLVAGSYKLTTSDANGCKDSASVTITEPSLLKVSESVVFPLCNGFNGSASILASGGTTPFNYEWTDVSGSVVGATASLSSLSAGVYNYAVKDANQCTYADSVIIRQPSVLSLSLQSKTHPVCSGNSTGIIVLKATGGITPYQYQNNAGTFQSQATFNSLKDGLYSLTVKDKNNCVDTINVSLPNIDAVAPVVLLKKPTLFLNTAGLATLAVSQIDSSISDNCGIASISLSKTQFTCGNIGANTVQTTVVDINGNTQQVNTTVFVRDTIRPVINTQSVNIYLGSSGTATVFASQLNNGSTDNCGIDSIVASPTNFVCRQRGQQSVRLEIFDGSRNRSTRNILINVLDTIKPVAKIKNISVYLNKAGEALITPNDVDNGTSDNCGIKTLSISKNFFNCTNVGSNTITFTAIDSSNNSASLTVRVSVFDTISPIVKVKVPVVYMTSQGFTVITPDDVDDNSFDNCKIASRSISKSVFTCSDLGQNIINFTVSDIAGNTTVVKAKVEVKDTTRPRLKFRNITAFLDRNGLAAASAFDADLGSTDNCDLQTIGLTKNIFNCKELGPNVVEFYATDKAGNVNRSNITITVRDTMRPVILAQDIKIYLDSLGTASITPADIDKGSYDNCGIVFKGLSQTIFSCSDVGQRILLYTVKDTSGNTSTRLFNATIADTLSPKLTTWTQTLYFNDKGTVNLQANTFVPFAYDNCGFKSFYFNDSTFDCANTGLNQSTFYAIDKNNNIAVQPFYTYVFDSIPPKVVLKTDTIYIDTLGVAQLKPSDVIAQIYDNCKVNTVFLSKTIFTSADFGDNYVELFAYDDSYNEYYSGPIVKVTVLLGDADRDSIPDYLETSADFDGDGVKNYLDWDSDNDGVLDRIENLGLRELQDLDKDGYPNIWDLDSDDDKIFDVTECNGPDADRNGRFGAGRIYVTNIGIPLLANDGEGILPVDTDKDLAMDYQDADSDSDGISDFIENGAGKIELIDSDGDKIADFRDADSDNDGISDAIEKNEDFDNDGIPNYLDDDSDGDFISDLIETNNDKDKDGFGNWLDLDSDDDQLSDVEEGLFDEDNDGLGNWLDNDSDNDGITDDIEGKFDQDNDGFSNYRDVDSDADGIPDVIEGVPFTGKLPADTDGDGVYDYLDEDSDNDKINDVIETVADPDTDGIGNWRDPDSDNDGVLDLLEGRADTDGDGIPDSIDDDSDNDGIPDLIEGFADADGDGIPNSLDLDSDDDGINDVLDALGKDADGDGFLDAGELPLGFVDSDKDGVMNSLDRDSDDDAIFDLYEASYRQYDVNVDGRIDGIDTDKDGIKDDVDGSTGVFGDLYDVLEVKYDDGDGLPEFIDLDSDNDGISDAVEHARSEINPVTLRLYTDVDNDGKDNYVDLDSDADNILDQEEGTLDPDDDGDGNWIDEDSDGDVIADSVETSKDFDNDGTPNYLDLDSDDDELSDKLETELDADKNKIMDFVDPNTTIPEIFTPNGDGINEVLYIKGLRNYPKAMLTVFDQWGHVVYQSPMGYQNDWNGTQQSGPGYFRGTTVTEGLYYYILDHNTESGAVYIRPQTKGNVYIKP
jgi:gliding motility-associated-like protein